MTMTISMTIATMRRTTMVMTTNTMTDISMMITATIIRIRTIIRMITAMTMPATMGPAAITITTMARAPTISIITARCRKRFA